MRIRPARQRHSSARVRADRAHPSPVRSHRLQLIEIIRRIPHHQFPVRTSRQQPRGRVPSRRVKRQRAHVAAVPDAHSQIRHRPPVVAVIHANQIIRSSGRRVPSRARHRLDARQVRVDREALRQPRATAAGRPVRVARADVQGVPEDETLVRAREDGARGRGQALAGSRRARSRSRVVVSGVGARASRVSPREITYLTVYP